MGLHIVRVPRQQVLPRASAHWMGKTLAPFKHTGIIPGAGHHEASCWGKKWGLADCRDLF